MGAKDLFPEVRARKFDRTFICRRCGARIRADPAKVRMGKVKCRKCKSKNLRQVKSEISLGR
ncbi:MAG TPA: 50S ribosomal protein L40e [Candidatus Nanopusillus sp.]|nr:50S ribosomal protein L40e [Candidatus Nanopusillus sp.]HIP90411.1 50S ribosomal protein L40e [Candidatus Nanopusillus sp.]